MSFFAVVREGTETVLFLQASAFRASQIFSSVAAAMGVMLAVGMTVLLFRGLHRVPMRRIFQFTSILLLLFAVSLVIGGVEELMEAMA